MEACFPLACKDLAAAGVVAEGSNGVQAACCTHMHVQVSRQSSDPSLYNSPSGEALAR